jgi:hypothetical protein
LEVTGRHPSGSDRSKINTQISKTTDSNLGEKQFQYDFCNAG